MYVKVRQIGSTSKDTILNISRLSTVKSLKELIDKETDIEPERQRLFYKGKQLEDEYKLFDYNIVLNDVIQLMVRSEVLQTSKPQEVDEKKDTVEKDKQDEEKTHKYDKTRWKSTPSSLFFKSGDYVDVKSEANGTWYEGQIVDILVNAICDCCGTEVENKENLENSCGTNPELQEDIVYVVTFDRSSEDFVETKLNKIRPRSRTVVDVFSMKEGDIVLVNYNLEDPSSRGLWYDFRISRVTKTGKSIFGDILISSSNFKLKDCRIKFVNEVYKIEERIPVKDRDSKYEEKMKDSTTVKKTLDCSVCQDNDDKLCRECGCNVCGGKEEPEKQLVCDECECSYHLKCLKPPLECIPDEEEWFCAECKTDVSEVVMAGEKLKASKKKASLVSSKSETKRDWGSGMACVGRTKECTIVPSNHYGPIPGVEVGTSWLFRVQVSEAGVHRPHVAGIHGREVDGAYSIVLSGGYEDDLDNGEEFLYTGAGGRDLSGNKRTAEQSCHQQLTRTNKALARNCDAPVDDKKGAKAKNWKNGKPVRVVRNHKLSGHSKYAPEKGNRYDGIYKVVEYWKEKGKSGFDVWRYRLRRDDETPAPWTAAGKKRVEALGLKMIYPDGYEEAKAMEKDKTSSPSVKRKITSPEPTKAKKMKAAAYKLPADVKKLIQQDSNTKLWEDCEATLNEGKPAFLAKVAEIFTCICCQELLFEPITTECLHNMCKKCLKRSLAADVTTCPYCRKELGKEENLVVNEHLSSILLNLFPGYENGR
ncbi:E3 ubiquitin-protein ligase UHRF1-like [Ischnura elegans]|uniref:E3 ubiquitin-protein ligase UHRF1-like n=1 Tax=Ischnura elegans TaxID=197161 RepID=UPI001ED8A5B0|nr:E3 ubiquitin-protein ligase UHRF1-like [Ischnura elegans]